MKAKLFAKFLRRLLIACCSLLVILLLKAGWVTLNTKRQGTFDEEKVEILQRRNWLIENVITSPKWLLSKMPQDIGEQFQGEWALYTCSMTATALRNIAHLYPTEKDSSLKGIEQLIKIALSPEIRKYDYQRWGDDPLESLDGENSHISYLSHLAWMICNYKSLGGNEDYDYLLEKLCSTMNRRILDSRSLNLPTYPDEPIYIPDMLVAILALKQYSDMHNNKYQSTILKWIEKVETEWTDSNTKLLAAYLEPTENKQNRKFYIRGSYSALNCYYLTLINPQFAKEQYENTKKTFQKHGLFCGLKEYPNKSPFLYFDVDAGPIFLGLSPSGTAFILGAATYFADQEYRKELLKTAEIFGSSVAWNGKRHYLLADYALVGEAIELAMRTNKALITKKSFVNM